MNGYKTEIQELKNDFQELWNKINDKSENLGLAVDKNSLKNSLLEILYRANEIREELIETGILQDDVSKYVPNFLTTSIEFEDKSTLEKILTQFDNIITEVNLISIKCELSGLSFKENTMIELLRRGYEILNVNDGLIYSYNIEDDNLFITEIDKYKNGEKSSDGIKLLDFITSIENIKLTLNTLQIYSGNVISKLHKVEGYEICISFSIIRFQDDIPWGDVISTFIDVDAFEKDFPIVQKIFSYGYKKGYASGSFVKSEK